MVLSALKLSSLTHVEAGQLVKTTLKDLHAAGISATADVHINNYINQLIAKTNIYDKGLLQIAKNEETEKLDVPDRIRDVDIAIFRR